MRLRFWVKEERKDNYR